MGYGVCLIEVDNTYLIYIKLCFYLNEKPSYPLVSIELKNSINSFNTLISALCLTAITCFWGQGDRFLDPSFIFGWSRGQVPCSTSKQRVSPIRSNQQRGYVISYTLKLCYFYRFEIFSVLLFQTCE